MDTKQLRQKILDLAIRGKLVPQDPNDEPASVLLERVKAEKERLIAEGKIKRSKKSAASSDKPHYPFEIPNNWVWTTIGEIASTILYGVSESAKESGTFKLLRITDIQNNRVNWQTVPFTNYDEQKAAAYLLRDGDILFARTGATVGKSYLVEGLSEPSIYASYLIRVQTSTAILPTYTKLFFESGFYWEQISLNSVGVGQPNVNGTTLASLLMPIPPYQEQKRIVEESKKWLSVIDVLDFELEGLMKSIDVIKPKILDLAINGKLVPQDPADEPAVDMLKRINPNAVVSTDTSHYNGQNLPNGWIQCKFSDLFNVRSARRVHKADWRSEGIPFYRAREIGKLSDLGTVDNDLYIDNLLYSEFAKSGVPQSGDIMITAVGTLGKTYIVRKGDKFYYKDGSVLCIENRNGIDPRYIEMFISSSHFKEQYIWESQGTTVATLTMDRINSYSFALPPLNEQKRIVSKVDELFAVIDQIKQSLE